MSKIRPDSEELERLKEKAKKEGGVAVDLSAVVAEFVKYGVPPLPLTFMSAMLAHSRKLRMMRDGEIDDSSLAYKMALKFVLDTQMLANRKAMEDLFNNYMKAEEDDEDEGGEKRDETPILH